jgi:hypothetical protein
MPIQHILDLLIEERDRISGAIAALQGTSPRRGHSLAVTEPSATAVKPAQGRRKFTPAQRKKQAERMKAYWAAKRAQGSKPVGKKK